VKSSLKDFAVLGLLLLLGASLSISYTFAGKLDMPYEFFIGKIFSKKVTSRDSKNVSICTSGISDLITKNL
jgi:hypothetical protein